MSDNPATNLYTALLAAQKAMGPVKKDASNQAFRSKYATLQSVIETIEEPLHANGLVLVQRLQYDRIGRDGGAGEGTPILITELIHAASGEKIDSAVPVVCKDPLDPQKVGGALTYFRRYSLLALLNLAPEDDDGNVAAQPRPVQRPQTAPPARTAPQASSTSRPAAAPQGGGPPPKRALAEVERELAPLAKQVRLNDEALSGPEYQRYHELEAERKALYTGLLDAIRDDEADPKDRRMALHQFYESADTIARLTQRVEAVKQSGLPTGDLAAAYNYHHKRLAEQLAPASIAG